MDKDTKYLEELEIVFENCDFVKLSKNFVESFYFGDIVKVLRKFNVFSSEIMTYQIAKDISIQIDYRKLKEDNSLTDFGELALTRLLKSRDITQIHLKYSNNETEWFYVDWSNTQDTINEFQYNDLNKTVLTISINKDNNSNKVLKTKLDYLNKEVDKYKEEISDKIIQNSKYLLEQLKKDYLPDEIYLTDESNKESLRFNWYEDYLDVFMVDVYLDRIEIKLFLNNESGEVKEFYKLIYPEDIKINSIISDYLSCKENEVPQYRIANCLNFNKKED